MTQAVDTVQTQFIGKLLLWAQTLELRWQERWKTAKRIWQARVFLAQDWRDDSIYLSGYGACVSGFTWLCYSLRSCVTGHVVLSVKDLLSLSMSLRVKLRKSVEASVDINANRSKKISGSTDKHFSPNLVVGCVWADACVPAEPLRLPGEDMSF